MIAYGLDHAWFTMKQAFTKTNLKSLLTTQPVWDLKLVSQTQTNHKIALKFNLLPFNLDPKADHQPPSSSSQQSETLHIQLPSDFESLNVLAYQPYPSSSFTLEQMIKFSALHLFKFMNECKKNPFLTTFNTSRNLVAPSQIDTDKGKKCSPTKNVNTI